MSQERNKCIDTVKGIACILVVFIQYPFPGEFGEFVKAIARFAVPFFFMTSGYYFSSSYVLRMKDNNNHRNIKKFFMIILFSTFYCEIFEVVHFKSLILALQKQINSMSILKLIFFNDTNNFVHLWYLWAILYCYVIFAYLERYPRKMKKVCFLPFLLIVGLILGTISRWFDIGDVYLYRNWLFVGMPFFSMGYVYRDKYSNVISKLQNKNVVLIISIIAGFLLTAFESKLFGNLEIYFGTVILAFSLFAFCIENPRKEIIKCISIYGQKYSMWIYILHWGIMHFEYKIMDLFHLNSNRVYLWMSPIILVIYTSICAMVMVFILEQIKNRKRKRKNGY